MSGVGLFLIGSFVTLLVFAALGLLMYGAVLDGRDEARRQRRRDAAEAVPARRARAG